METRHGILAVAVATLLSVAIAAPGLSAAPVGSVNGTCLVGGIDYGIEGYVDLARPDAMQVLASFHTFCDPGTMEWTWTPSE